MISALAWLSPRIVSGGWPECRLEASLRSNLSPWLCIELSDLFPNSVHVRDVGLREADDSEIWNYAARHCFAIVTKDADFRQRSFFSGHPPKIVWLRIGNCSTMAIADLLRNRSAIIEEFL